MKKSDFYYDLPKEFIAQEPSLIRDQAKLMVLNKSDHSINHLLFKDIIKYLNPDDVLVLNDTKVIPARLYMKKQDTGGIVEILITNNTGEDTWTGMLSPGRRVRIGTKLSHPSNKLSCEIIDKNPNGDFSIKFSWDKSVSFIELLEDIGKTPLPPYIKSDPDKYKEYYQTIYAKVDGSVAAPTAGLHFTEELINKIKDKGVKVVYLTLHVGPGTFKPVKMDNIEDHIMDSEYFSITKECTDIINNARNNGGRCIAVGTTVCRTLEFSSLQNGELKANTGWTNMFIKPPYKFKVVDAVITNFHLPESTLLMLVSAFYDREKMLEAYKTAVENNYRFYSFGDAMFIF